MRGREGDGRGDPRGRPEREGKALKYGSLANVNDEQCLEQQSAESASLMSKGTMLCKEAKGKRQFCFVKLDVFVIKLEKSRKHDTLRNYCPLHFAFCPLKYLLLPHRHYRIHPGGLHGWNKAGDDPDENRKADADDDITKVEVDVETNGGREGFGDQKNKEQAHQPADQAKNNGFDQEFQQNHIASGA